MLPTANRAPQETPAGLCPSQHVAETRRFLIQMSGAPGAGKSTLAKLLSNAINGIVIDHDLVRSFFLESGIGFGEAAKLAYSLQWTLAGDFLRQGRNTIIDSTCNYQETLDQGAALARRYDYHYQYVECRVENIDILERRLRSRVSQRSQRTGIHKPPPDASSTHANNDDALACFRRWIENPARPAQNAIIVDSTAAPEDCLGEILRQMSLQGLASSSSALESNPETLAPG